MVGAFPLHSRNGMYIDSRNGMYIAYRFFVGESESG